MDGGSPHGHRDTPWTVNNACACLVRVAAAYPRRVTPARLNGQAPELADSGLDLPATAVPPDFLEGLKGF